MAQQSDPLGGFIQNFMQMQGMLEAQHQFDEQQEMQRRAMANQELQNFASLAQLADGPDSVASLARWFGEQNPSARDAFQDLAGAFVPTAAVQRDRASLQGHGAMSPEDQGRVGRAAAFGTITGMPEGQLSMEEALGRVPGETMDQATRQRLDLEVGASQAASIDVQMQQLAEQMRQFDMSFWEQARQHGIESALKSRGLDLQAAQIAQTGALGQLNAQIQGGTFPLMMMADRRERVQALQNQLQTGEDLTPENRAALEREIRENQGTLTELNRLWEGQIGRLEAAGASGGEGISFNQVLQAIGTAYDDIGQAKSRGEQAAAIARYNHLNEVYRNMGVGFQGPPLQVDKWSRAFRLPTISAVDDFRPLLRENP